MADSGERIPNDNLFCTGIRLESWERCKWVPVTSPKCINAALSNSTANRKASGCMIPKDGQDRSARSKSNSRINCYPGGIPERICQQMNVNALQNLYCMDCRIVMKMNEDCGNDSRVTI